MDKTTIDKVLGKLPPESAQYAVRDITLLTSSIFNETHFISLKKIFGIDFSMLFWFTQEDGQVCFYRPGPEYDLFAKTIGEKALGDEAFVKKISDVLIGMTDQINHFIENHKTLEDLLPKWQEFYELYRDFFAYHQVVYWASVYLTELPEDKKAKVEDKINVLDSAYKYNEKVVPDVETYFIDLGIGELVYAEVGKQNPSTSSRPAGKRSVLTLDGKTTILPIEEASLLAKAIRDDYQKYLDNLTEVKGLAVSKGVARGKVRLVTDLNKLSECEDGDILVTTQTRPQYNSAIHKVAGIVTDEGGYLCHASMLAREFKMPCIVGTKNATKMLKTGDTVEVDADNGVVKIIK